MSNGLVLKLYTDYYGFSSVFLQKELYWSTQMEEFI